MTEETAETAASRPLAQRDDVRSVPDDIADLIERSSLGTPEAKAARDSVPAEVARIVVEMSELPDTQGCTEWSCMYHGQVNETRAKLKEQLRLAWHEARDGGAA